MVQDFLSRLPAGDVLPTITVVVVFTLAFLAGMVIWLSLQWRLHRRTEMEAALKQEMLRRGMSAEEIERVVRASGSSAPEPTAAPAEYGIAGRQ